MTRGSVVFLFAAASASQPFVVSTVAGGSPPPFTNPKAISLQPSRVAIGSSGSIYLGSNAMLLKLDTAGNLTRVGGNARPGCMGDGGPATSAQINQPTGIAVDSYGDVFFADSSCQTVRKIDSTGKISTVAGNGLQGYTGDSGPAAQARLNVPLGVAVDGAGNLYIADSQNYVVREVLASNGNIVTFAGNGLRRKGTDGAPATQSSFIYPYDVATDGSGNVFIVDEFDCRVRIVNSQGIITTFAGNGNVGPIRDGSSATTTTLDFPIGAVWGARSQSLYILQSQDAIAVVSGGTIRTFAGVGNSAQTGLKDGQPAGGAFIDGSGIAVDPADNVIVTAASQLWRISQSQSSIASLLAGNGDLAYSGDGASALTAQLFTDSVAVDA